MPVPRDRELRGSPGDLDRPGTGPAADADEQDAGKAADQAAEIAGQAAAYGLTVTAKLLHDADPVTGEWDGTVTGPAVISDGPATDAIVTVEGTFTVGDREAFLTAEANANAVLDMIPMVRPGSVWGTDATSVGGLSGLQNGYVRMNKSGTDIAVARHLAQVPPPAGDSGPDAPRGSGENRTAAAPRPPAEFPDPPHPAAPGTGGGRARESARPRPGQQVSPARPPRTSP